jgi:hypothetical protein
MELILSKSLRIKKAIFLVVSLTLPLLWYLYSYTVFYYAFSLYLAYIFYEVDHYNIRFVVALIAAEAMISSMLFEVNILVWRNLFSMEDRSTEILLSFLIDVFLPFILVLCILNRGRLVDWFRQTTGSGQSYRLIGTEWLILLSCLLISLSYLVTTLYILPEILAVTDYDSMSTIWENTDKQWAFKALNDLHLLLSMMQLFALQSYNYKRCRREWRIGL